MNLWSTLEQYNVGHVTNTKWQTIIVLSYAFFLQRVMKKCWHLKEKTCSIKKFFGKTNRHIACLECSCSWKQRFITYSLTREWACAINSGHLVIYKIVNSS